MLADLAASVDALKGQGLASAPILLGPVFSETVSFWIRQHLCLTFTTLSLSTEGLPEKHDRTALRAVSGRLHWRCGQRSAHVLPALPLPPASACQVRKDSVFPFDLGWLWTFPRWGQHPFLDAGDKGCCPCQPRETKRTSAVYICNHRKYNFFQKV